MKTNEQEIHEIDSEIQISYPAVKEPFSEHCEENSFSNSLKTAKQSH